MLIANYALNLYFLLLKIKIKSILKENRNSMRFELEVEISSPAFLLFIGETTNFFTGKMGCQISSSALIISTVIKTGENRTDFDAHGFLNLFPCTFLLISIFKKKIQLTHATSCPMMKASKLTVAPK